MTELGSTAGLAAQAATRPSAMPGAARYVAQVALEEARLLTQPVLRAALDRLDPRTRHVSGYHLGFWDSDGTPGCGHGKSIRPALALLSTRAGGGTPQQAAPAAAACELVHNFSLLHDDVMDGDRERRHRAAAWTKFGVPMAILAGDALLNLANELVSEAVSPAVPRAIRLLNATTRRLIAGQSADISFEEIDQISLDECLQMAADKTGALLACSASLGAVLVDAPPKLVNGLGTYGEHLGLAFQLTDDLLGIWGSPERTGKPVWSDLRARKMSLPVVAALESRTSASLELRRFYSKKENLSDSELETAVRLIERAGGEAWTHREIGRQCAASQAALEGLGLPTTVHEELIALISLLRDREN